MGSLSQERQQQQAGTGTGSDGVGRFGKSILLFGALLSVMLLVAVGSMSSDTNAAGSGSISTASFITFANGPPPSAQSDHFVTMDSDSNRGILHYLFGVC